MDYTYQKEGTVKIDFKTEKAIFDIKDSLNQIVKRLEDLNNKIENISRQANLDNS
jgi:archaellum component FlaC